MKKINFTCPRCGGHRLIGEKPLQLMQIDVLGWDDDGDLLLDHNRPRIAYGEGDDFEIHCEKCYAQFSPESVAEMFNSND